MNINIKYLVVTVLSIFMALAIGMFIGFVMDSGDVIGKETSGIVEQIQEQFDYIKEENESMRAEVAKVNAVNEELNTNLGVLTASITSNKLAGRNIALVQTGKDYDYSYLREVLEKAGARVSSFTRIDKSLYENKEEIEKLYEGLYSSKSEDILKSVASELSKVISSSESSPLIVALVEKGYIELEGAYDTQNDTIVVAGGSQKENESQLNLSKQMMAEMKSGDLVVGVEGAGVSSSYVDAFKDIGVSSVDNVDTYSGKLSLIMVLNGLQGNFGEKDSSQDKVPDFSKLLNE